MTRVVDFEHRLGRVTEAEAVDAIFFGERLQFAVVISHTGVAFAMVVAKHQVDDVPTSATNARRMRFDIDRLRDREGARRLKRSEPFDLDDTDAADAGDAKIVVLAERGDMNPETTAGLEDGGPNGDFDIDAIDGSTEFGGVRAPADSLAQRVWQRVIRRPSAWAVRPWPRDRVIRYVVTVISLSLTTAIMMRVVHFNPLQPGADLIFDDTTPTGGDFGAHEIGRAHV